jgi:hypothetical protein
VKKKYIFFFADPGVCKGAQAESVTKDFGRLTNARVGEAKNRFFASPTLT